MGKIEDRLKKIENRIEKLENKLELITPEIEWTKIGDLEWSEDLGRMNWNDAVKACEKAGGRLPTRLELIDLYDNHYDECRELIESSPSDYFWSATEGSATGAWYVNLSSGSAGASVRTTGAAQVRCVR